MRAEIIAIGDELTSGQRLDTNSQWLSERLGELGVDVVFHTTVGDDLEANVAVFRAAIDRADVVVATGGLGPTADDLTREAIAVAAGVELVQDDAALEHIRQLFARRGGAMPERNVLQAQFPARQPAGAQSARHGPGHRHDDPARVLPAVPVVRAAGRAGRDVRDVGGNGRAGDSRGRSPVARVIRHRRIKCFGVGESDLEAMLPDMIRREREPLVGITVSDATITLRITASGPNEAACRKAMEPTVAQIRELLGVLVFGEEEDELEHAVVRLLNEQRQTVAVAEWATDGLVVAVAGRGGRGERTAFGRRGRARRGRCSNRCWTLTAARSGECRRGRSRWPGRSANEPVPTTAWASRRFRRSAECHCGRRTGDMERHVARGTGDRRQCTSEGLSARQPPGDRPSTRAAKQALNMLRLALLNRE